MILYLTYTENVLFNLVRTIWFANESKTSAEWKGYNEHVTVTSMELEWNVVKCIHAQNITLYHSLLSTQNSDMTSDFEKMRTGACLCKKITFHVEGEELNFTICHCTNCRRNCGSTYTSNAWFPDRVNPHSKSIKNFWILTDILAISMDIRRGSPEAIR